MADTLTLWISPMNRDLRARAKNVNLFLREPLRAAFLTFAALGFCPTFESFVLGGFYDEM